MRGKQFIANLTIIHFALLMGLMMIAIILYFMYGTSQKELVELPFHSSYLVLFSAIPWFVSRIVYRNGMSKASQLPSLPEKLLAYRQTFIGAAMISEFFATTALVFYFVYSPYPSVLVVAGVAMFSLFLLRPSVKRAEEELNMNQAERKELAENKILRGLSRN